MSAFFKHLIVPSLPLALLTAAFSLLAATQDLLMPLMVGLSPEQLTATTAILKFSASSNPASSSSVIALFGLPLFLIFFVVFATLQVFYLDRLVLIREPVETKQDKVELEVTNP